MRFVLDNSITMRWAFRNGKPEALRYALAVLDSFEGADALVPALWHLEVANVLLAAERDARVGEADAVSFLARLDGLPILTDSAQPAMVRGQTFMLAREHALSAYDAAYLELAMREKLPLATLDADLRKAANRAGLKLYLV